MSSIKNPLRRARAFLGLTQEDMAQAWGVSRSTYQRREALAEEYVKPADDTHARVLVARKTLEAVFGIQGADYDE